MPEEKTVRAELRFYRVSPKRVRPFLRELKGKAVEEAMQILHFLNKRFARDLLKLLQSAVSNAENKGLNKEALMIEEFVCNEGPRLKRYRPGHRGIAFPFRRKLSHIRVVLKEEKSLVIGKRKKKKEKMIAKKKEKQTKKQNG